MTSIEYHCRHIAQENPYIIIKVVSQTHPSYASGLGLLASAAPLARFLPLLVEVVHIGELVETRNHAAWPERSIDHHGNEERERVDAGALGSQ